MRILPPQFQLGHLRRHLKTVRSEMIGREAFFEGWMTPHAICDRYLVEIRYLYGRFPQIRVLDPVLTCRPDRKVIPHMWDQTHLCLHNPQRRSLNLSIGFDRTIVPWIALWLYYYEDWFASGEWRGGGGHPRLRKPKKPSTPRTGG